MWIFIIKKLSIAIIATLLFIISNNVFADQETESLVRVRLCNDTSGHGGSMDIYVHGMDVDETGNTRDKHLMVGECTDMGYDAYDPTKFIYAKVDADGSKSLFLDVAIGLLDMPWVDDGHQGIFYFPQASVGQQIKCDLRLEYYEADRVLYCNDWL